jgi:hypothetical protein
MLKVDKTSRNKYPENSQGKYNCPAAGCDRIGKNGFDTPQGVGRHVATAHRGLVGAATELGIPPAFPEDGQGRPDDVEPHNGNGKSNGNALAGGRIGELDPTPIDSVTSQATTNASATAAAMKVISLPDLRGWTPAQMRRIFDVALEVLALDAKEAEERKASEGA